MEHDAFSDTREFVPLAYTEGQPCFCCLSHDHQKRLGWRRSRWEARRRRRDRTVSWSECRSVRWNSRNRPIHWVYCLLHKSSWIVSKEKVTVLDVGVLNTSYETAQRMLADPPQKHTETWKRGQQRRETEPFRIQLPLSRQPQTTCPKHRIISKYSLLESRPTSLLV